MASNSSVTLTGLARKFVLDNILEEDVAKDAFSQASNNNIPFITYLVQNNLLKHLKKLVLKPRQSPSKHSGAAQRKPTGMLVWQLTQLSTLQN